MLEAPFNNKWKEEKRTKRKHKKLLDKKYLLKNMILSYYFQ